MLPKCRYALRRFNNACTKSQFEKLFSRLMASFRRACPPKPSARRRASCLNEIKHDGFRVIARKDAAKRLLAMRIAVFELIRAPPR
jgi:hypothetical protein